MADDRFGNPAKVGQGLGLLFDEARAREGERRGAEHRDKNLRLANLAGFRIDYLNRLAGVIRLHHRTCVVAVAEGGMRPALVGAEVLAKPSVAVTFRMGGTVFLPQQRQRHALALEFLRHISPIRLAQVPRRPPHAASASPPWVTESIAGFPDEDRAGAFELAERRYAQAAQDFGVMIPSWVVWLPYLWPMKADPWP